MRKLTFLTSSIFPISTNLIFKLFRRIYCASFFDAPCRKFFVWENCFAFAIGSLTFSISLVCSVVPAVSYTHLDVYKRQVVDWT